MATTYKRDTTELPKLQIELQAKFQAAFIELQHVKVDYLFASGARNPDTNELEAFALKKNGRRALGICRALPLKDRAKGLGDVEISIDKDWWDESTDEERLALLDHELTHVVVCKNQDGILKTDDLGRPKIKMRPHDYETGDFTGTAKRHGRHSQEVIAARRKFQADGQAYWPDLVELAQIAGKGTRIANLEVHTHESLRPVA